MVAHHCLAVERVGILVVNFKTPGFASKRLFIELQLPAPDGSVGSLQPFGFLVGVVDQGWLDSLRQMTKSFAQNQFVIRILFLWNTSSWVRKILRSYFFKRRMLEIESRPYTSLDLLAFLRGSLLNLLFENSWWCFYLDVLLISQAEGVNLLKRIPNLTLEQLVGRAGRTLRFELLQFSLDGIYSFADCFKVGDVMSYLFLNSPAHSHF